METIETKKFYHKVVYGKLSRSRGAVAEVAKRYDGKVMNILFVEAIDNSTRKTEGGTVTREIRADLEGVICDKKLVIMVEAPMKKHRLAIPFKSIAKDGNRLDSGKLMAEYDKNMETEKAILDGYALLCSNEFAAKLNKATSDVRAVFKDVPEEAMRHVDFNAFDMAFVVQV